MPYIDIDDRSDLEPQPHINAQGPGELNFQITALLDAYMRANGVDYQVINDIIGAVEGAKLEFYRRIAVPYEDKKIRLNTDVYTYAHRSVT